MIRLGIVDFDTSHAVEFTRRLNHVDIAEDQPFACSLDDARAMVHTAEVKHVPLMSSSSLRYAPEVVAAKGGQGKLGKVVGVTTYGPAPTHPRNPGLFHYGIHPTEMLYTL